MTTAAAIIIGDEILTGKFQDENGPWLATEARRIGLDLKRIVVIPDEIDVISAEVLSAHQAFDYVFTTGGIGPTHDDKTMESIARAFGEPLIRHSELERLIHGRMGERANEDALRMADVPRGADLWNEPGLRFPIVVCRNVVIFPGVPSFFQSKFRAISHRFSGVIVESRQFRTTEKETSIASVLRAAQTQWPLVNIGSYPRFATTPPSVIVTIDGRDTDALDSCFAWLRERIPHSED